MATKAILKILSFGGIDVEVSRQLADLKRLDPMKIFYKKMDLQVYNGDYEVPIRVFFPDEASCLEKDQIKGRKIMLFLHGGGWATEHVENYERVCSRMAQATGQNTAWRRSTSSRPGLWTVMPWQEHCIRIRIQSRRILL